MVAAESPPEKHESAARVKAAAWAWYQRSGGSVAPTAGRSEAFAVRCASRHSTSRFQREATSRSRMLATLASTVSDSALTSFSSIDVSSSLSQCTTSFWDATDPDDGSSLERNSNADQISNPDCNADADQSSSLDLVALHPTACWDCGSSLFDSFELVAMSKKLDAELHEPSIDSESALPGLCKGFQQQPVLSLCDTPHNSVSSESPLPYLLDDYDTSDTYDVCDKLISAPDKQSKQAVYDMFCRYGDASKHVNKQTKSRTSISVSCGKDSKKHKPRSGLMSLHILAKALHNIRHPSSHPSDGTADAQHHHHRHQSPYSPYHRTKALPMSANGLQVGASWTGDRLLYDDATDKGQRKERHIHHHHHHHYHYLFHSDDDFRLQPLDKSLMVAAAGLRSPKVNPVLSSYLESPARVDLGMDYGRKWADLGSIPPVVAPIFNNEYASS